VGGLRIGTCLREWRRWRRFDFAAAHLSIVIRAETQIKKQLGPVSADGSPVVRTCFADSAC
jgi:hypothetical protein